jgi:membrane protease YdiL (CAAX protease family)
LIRKDFFGSINTASLHPLKSLKLAGVAYLLAFPTYLVIQIIWVASLSSLKSSGADIDTSQQILVTTVREAPSLSIAIMLGLSGIILAPISEELVFRGAIYRFFKSSFSPRLAIILSALLFAAIHSNLLSLIPLFFLGIFLAIAYEKSGNILVPIIFHAIFNTVNVIIILFNR